MGFVYRQKQYRYLSTLVKLKKKDIKSGLICSEKMKKLCLEIFQITAASYRVKERAVFVPKSKKKKHQISARKFHEYLEDFLCREKWPFVIAKVAVTAII